MNEKNNEIRLVFGMLLSPIKVGLPAVIQHKDGPLHTTPVRSIVSATHVRTVFETEDSIYCVAPYLRPGAGHSHALAHSA